QFIHAGIALDDQDRLFRPALGNRALQTSCDFVPTHGAFVEDAWDSNKRKLVITGFAHFDSANSFQILRQKRNLKETKALPGTTLTPDLYPFQKSQLFHCLNFVRFLALNDSPA